MRTKREKDEVQKKFTGPTCPRTFLTQGDTNKHRAHANKCKTQWGEEKPERLKCQKEGCGKKDSQQRNNKYMNINTPRNTQMRIKCTH